MPSSNTTGPAQFEGQVEGQGQFDVAILGGGPAAWSMAAALAPTGLNTMLLSPPSPTPTPTRASKSSSPKTTTNATRPPAPVWTNMYRGWVDQLGESVHTLFGDAAVLAAEYDTVHVIGKDANTTPRIYGRLDNAKLADALLRTANTGSFSAVSDTAAALAHHKTHTHIRTLAGHIYSARIVIDATGARSPFTVRPAQPAAEIANQLAYGLVARFKKPLLPENECTLMDWRGPEQSPPSFSYVLPLGDDTFLVEETVLATTSGTSLDSLKRRLRARLATDGHVIAETLGEELVCFPMNLPLPDRPQRTIAIGAASSIVHPATGYSVVASMRLAPRLATVIAKELASDALPGQVAEAAWSTVWSNDRVKAHGLERYGLERVLTMSQSEVRDFFGAFFRLPAAAQTTYLSGEASPNELADIMWQLFRSVPLRLRTKLASGNPLTLVKSLLG